VFDLPMEHSPTSATGTGWERPWHGVQRAAWQAVKKGEESKG